MYYMTEKEIIKACKQVVKEDALYYSYAGMGTIKLKREGEFIYPLQALRDHFNNEFLMRLAEESLLERLKFSIKLILGL